MPSERISVRCSNIYLVDRRYLDEATRKIRQKRFVECQRDGRPCVPGRFPDHCPNREGKSREVVLVRSGNVFEELGAVTVVTNYFQK